MLMFKVYAKERCSRGGALALARSRSIQPESAESFFANIRVREVLGVAVRWNFFTTQSEDTWTSSAGASACNAKLLRATKI